MKAVVLAAGKGSRIGSDSRGIPKSFLEVNGKKIIEHQVDAIKALGDAVSEIVIVTGYKNWLFEELFGKDPKITLVKNPFYEHCNVLGSLWFARNYFSEGFFFMHADTPFDPPVLQKLKEATGSVRFAVEFKNTVEEEMKVRVVDGKVVEVNKTMDCKSAHGEFTGVALISPEVANTLKAQVEQIIERDLELNRFFEHAVQQLIDADKIQVQAVDIEDFRSIEIDFPEDFERAQKTFEKGFQ